MLLLYVKEALAPLTVNPAPLAAAAVVASLASVRFTSEIATAVELIVVVVPCTVRLPVIVASPATEIFVAVRSSLLSFYI